MMKASKFVIVAATTVALVGSIGLTYAQSTFDDSSGAQVTAQNQHSRSEQRRSSDANRNYRANKSIPESVNENSVGGAPEGSTSNIGYLDLNVVKNSGVDINGSGRHFR
jgi:hypothetical protein